MPSTLHLVKPPKRWSEMTPAERTAVLVVGFLDHVLQEVDA
jgi:hypothetical protein